MTDWGGEGLAESVRSALQSMSRFPLVATTVEGSGQRWPAIRPVLGDSGPSSFSIALIRDPLTISAQLLMDPFAGSLVRAVGLRVNADRSRWRSLIAQARDLGINVEIRVNDIVFDLEELPTDTWRSLEVVARLRVRRWRSPDGLADMWGAAAGSCLCLVLSESLSEESVTSIEGQEEGQAVEVLSKRYERNPINRLQSIQYHGFLCWVCDSDLSVIYPGIGEEFIEVHHIIPVSEMGPGYRVDPVTEMVPLCPNCHGIVHRESPPVHPEKLRSIMGREPKASTLRS